MNEPYYNADQTQVAIEFRKKVRHLVTCPSKGQYVFDVRAQICLAWVNVGSDEQHILSLMGTCCGGVTKQVQYVYASEVNARRWAGENI
jgi:hypothetical protein